MPAACEQERILSVTELTDRMRRTLEGTFPFVWVRGEIGELSFPGSGHIYFTLKDAGAQLQCVWFRDRQMRGRNFDPLTGEIFAEPRPDPVRLLRQMVGIVVNVGQMRSVEVHVQSAPDS